LPDRSFANEKEEILAQAIGEQFLYHDLLFTDSGFAWLAISADYDFVRSIR
jgi:hypothetical protein